MHARVGLATPYLGSEWMRCVQASVAACRELGLDAWLYDEDKWPSGFAGGLSVAAEPRYRAQVLVCKVDDRPALIGERLALFSARDDEGRLVDIRPCNSPQFNDENARIVQFYPLTVPLGNPWFNGFAYTNLLDPDAVRAFLECTHEAYQRAVGDEFGRTVPGIFTDEPCAFFRGPGAAPETCVPWDSRLPQVFLDRRGYDLIERLPSLFFDTGDYLRVRYDFWRTVTEMFVEAYTRQVFDWCEGHGVLYTGHYMAEDTMLSQIQWGQAASMPHYAYMHIPGIDKLGRQVNVDCGTVLTAKQLDSVACQTGKPRQLCENFGASGPAFALLHRKWLADWAAVCGITLSNPHLSMYSLRGERKRDFPPFMSYQSPWWPDNDMIADYVARLSYVLSQGERVVDILAVHPMTSAWALFKPGGSPLVRELDERLDRLLLALMGNRRDFHLGDETMMEKGGPCEAAVVPGSDGPRLRVGRAEYRAVVVPSCISLGEQTCRLLSDFARAGGIVLGVEPVPRMVDFKAAGTVLPEGTRNVGVEDIGRALDAVLPADVRIDGHPEIWCHHRRLEDRDVYFFTNSSLDAHAATTVRIAGTGRLEEWDPASGRTNELAVPQHNGHTEVRLELVPAGSRLLVQSRGKAAQGIVPRTADPECGSEVILGDEWRLSLLTPNALTLDTTCLKLGSADWSPAMHILDAFDTVKSSGVGAGFALRFGFDVAAVPDGDVFLAVEPLGRLGISVNGRALDTGTDCGWWTDISFRKHDITDLVHAGSNELVVEGTFDTGTELESIYLLGAFEVEATRIRSEGAHNGVWFDRYAPRFRVQRLPDLVRSVNGNLDLTASGLPFFAGRTKLSQTVRLEKAVEQARLEILDMRAAVAHVRVNGNDAGRVAWNPTGVDVSGLVRPGDNLVEIELSSTLRNLLGPHHLAGGEGNFTSPGSFRDKRRWTDDYILIPFGFGRVSLSFCPPRPL